VERKRKNLISVKPIANLSFSSRMGVGGGFEPPGIELRAYSRIGGAEVERARGLCSSSSECSCCIGL